MNYSVLFANLDRTLPYAALLFSYVALSFTGDLLKNKFFHLLAVAIIVLFSGLRCVMNPDMERYRGFYESSKSLTFSNFLEPSFVYICKVLGLMGLDYHAMFFVYSCITILFVFLGINNFIGRVKLSLLFFVMTPGLFLSSFIAIRESCALSLTFYATSLLFCNNLPRKAIKATLFALGSCLFHYTAVIYWVIFVLAYKLRNRNISWLTYLLAISVSAIIPTSLYIKAVYYTIYPLLGGKYQFFIDAFMNADIPVQTNTHLFTNAYYALIVIWLLYKRKEISKTCKYCNGILTLLVIGIVILNATKSFFEIQRVATYFLIYVIVLMPLLFSSINRKQVRMICAYSVLCVYLVNFVSGLYMFTEETQSYTYLNYSNILLPLGAR